MEEQRKLEDEEVNNTVRKRGWSKPMEIFESQDYNEAAVLKNGKEDL